MSTANRVFFWKCNTSVRILFLDGRDVVNVEFCHSISSSIVPDCTSDHPKISREGGHGPLHFKTVYHFVVVGDKVREELWDSGWPRLVQSQEEGTRTHLGKGTAFCL